jgi:hypothetical protein
VNKDSDLSDRINQQRLRNMLIDSLELWANPDLPRRFAAQHPSIHVPDEMANDAFDIYNDPAPYEARPEWAALTENEDTSFRRFQDAVDGVPQVDWTLELEHFLSSPTYQTVQNAALEALEVFMKRGRLSQNTEEWL